MPTREEMRGLAEEIVGSYADRIAGVAELQETVKMDLKEFRDYRIATGRETRADLARSVTDCRRSTGAMLERFSQAHSTMSKEMRADLAKSLADCKRSTGAMLKGFNAELKEVRSELAGVRDEWQTLTATIQAQRAGAAVEMGPAEAVTAPVEEMTPETTDLGNRVFEYLANHPDGTRMVEMEQEFGVTRIEMARLLKELMDENKVGRLIIMDKKTPVGIITRTDVISRMME